LQSYLLNIPSWNPKCGDDVVCISEVRKKAAEAIRIHTKNNHHYEFPVGAHGIENCPESIVGKQRVVSNTYKLL